MATNYKVLGQVAPANTSNANLYTVPASTQTIVSTLHVANVTATAATCRIYVRINGATAANGNAIALNSPVPANGFLAITQGITLNAGDIITVQSATSNALSFHAFGSEIS